MGSEQQLLRIGRVEGQAMEVAKVIEALGLDGSCHPQHGECQHQGA